MRQPHRHPDDETTPVQVPPQHPVLMVTVLGVNPEEHPEILHKVLARHGQRHRCVFVLDHDDFAPFLARGVALEYLTPLDLQAQHAALMDWPDYLSEKWMLLQLKWQPGQIIAYGMTADRFLNLSRAGRDNGL
ncbi:hypothetical protein [Pseudotabrizicola alkalilacus]|uniref:hypothetical protein n=1 Tax=Pseudotabrizicola alkalilacus TaxID=2305252 RepID=UPI001313D7F5|nr:hypothetical protein [Pseudotabrizicola alkalilacus]